MVSSNKILTVSYGTFSCTLEGFDESFETMKAIAEYFRDLAADDRYFGAEPPTPDAEMLARIAEREIARRVEARTEEGGIVLRPTLAAGGQPPQQAPGASQPESGTAERAAPPPESAPDRQTAAHATAPPPKADVAGRTAPQPDAAEDTVAQSDLAEDTAAQSSMTEDIAAKPAAAKDTAPQPGAAEDAAQHTHPAEDASAPQPTVAQETTAQPLTDATPDSAAQPATDTSEDSAAPSPAASDATPTAEEAAPAPEDTSAAAEGVADLAEETPEAGFDSTMAAMAPEAEGAPIAEDAPLDDDAALDQDLPAAFDEPTADDTTSETTAAGPAPRLPEVAAPARPAPSADAPSEAPLSSSLAARLQRIRAVVSRSAAPEAAPDAPPKEAEAITDAAQAPGQDSAAMRAPAAEKPTADETTPQASAPETAAQAANESPARSILAEAADTAPGAPSPESLAPEAPIADASEHADAPETAPREEIATDEAPRDPDTAAGPTASDQAHAGDAEPPLSDSHGEGSDTAPLSETEKAAPPTDAAAVPRSTLPPEEEAELAAELRAIEAELEATRATLNTDATQATDAPDTDAAQAPDTPASDATQPTDGPDSEAASAPPETEEPAPTSEADDAQPPETPADQRMADAPGADDAEIRAAARRTVKQGSDARAALEEAPEDAGTDDVARLMDEADTEMDRPESNRRRSALAHLRAAVAATRADGKLARKGPADAEVQAYREDLADVVRPRRPDTGGTRTPRPEEPRPAPLKLVAEQRVDVPDAAQETPAPVRPRRVARTQSEAPRGTGTEAGGFEAFAEAQGARELPELLEAAAAYLSFVEGQAHFSRPDLMKTVRESGAAEFSREDGLRHFGRLIRTGKIEKLRGGRFTVSGDIAYRPDDRAAG
ncbi:hypothetical protein [Rhodosalinus sediminis]|uniref:hypothetical protein n=1 Tax=Rhodosalinus sediminis TaxID=1940533 RepID=UPI002357CF1F|nr:hypothetical protein [Rhodosalinus sediminis]